MKKVYGKTPKGGRAEHDFYATDPIAAKLLLNVEKFDKNIWECASGENHLADVFKEYGYNVRTSDIVKRTPTTEVRDFLRTRKKWNGDIITNPPYLYDLEFVNKALSLVSEGHKVAMFLRLLFLESKKRRELFKNNPPKTVYVSSKRIKCGRDGKVESSKFNNQAYAWFVWEKGYKGDSVVKWINNGEELDEERMMAPREEAVMTTEKPQEMQTKTRIIDYWNQSITDAVCLVRSLYSNATGTDGYTDQVSVIRDREASTYPLMFLEVTINGLLTARYQNLISAIPTVEWNFNGYSMPQCMPRGTPCIQLYIVL